MEQLIIFLLFVVGSIISSVIQHKKKKAEEQQQRELEELTRSTHGARTQTAPPPKPVERWPKSAADWQEQLRRMLEGESQPPPVIKPILIPPEQRAPKPAPPRVQPSRTPKQLELSEGDLVFKSPLKSSTENYQRAANLYSNVQDRMRAIDLQTSTAKSGAARRRPPAQSEFAQRLKRNPRAIREAFIASVIFAAPKGLETAEPEVGR
jgi:hypothetical protein